MSDHDVDFDHEDDENKADDEDSEDQKDDNDDGEWLDIKKILPQQKMWPRNRYHVEDDTGDHLSKPNYDATPDESWGTIVTVTIVATTVRRMRMDWRGPIPFPKKDTLTFSWVHWIKPTPVPILSFEVGKHQVA